MNERFTLEPGEERELWFAVPEDHPWPCYLTVRARGRRANLVFIEEVTDGIRWRRLPVPLSRRIVAFVTGRNRWVFEGTPDDEEGG